MAQQSRYILSLLIIVAALIGDPLLARADYVVLRGGETHSKSYNGQEYGRWPIASLFTGPSPNAYVDLDDTTAYWAIGYGGTVADSIRLEIEFSHRNQSNFTRLRSRNIAVQPFPPADAPDITQLSVSSNSLILYVNYDLPLFDRATAFAGAGIGASLVKSSGTVGRPGLTFTVDGSEFNPTFAVNGGISYEIFNGVDLETRYALIDAGSYTAECDLVSVAFCSHSATADLLYQDISLGLRFHF
jgi:opacity protein-like surface antigen